ncbi:MAG TPA: thioesterase family protein [Alphaproteobacteria bacterium]
MTETEARRRTDYAYLRAVPTRWNDNDLYGHLNNVAYYEIFDTVINRFLIEEGGLDIARGPVIGIVPETRCRYLKPLRYPDVIDVGLAVARLGRTSVVYDIALFRQGEDDAAALGHFVHVFVARAAQDRTRPIPRRVRSALARIARAPEED